MWFPSQVYIYISIDIYIYISIDTYIYIYIAYLFLGQKVRCSLTYLNAYLSGSPSDVLAILHVIDFCWWLKSYTSLKLSISYGCCQKSCTSCDTVYTIKNKRMIYLLPYQRVQDFFYHFYSGFTRRFASQLLRKSSHPSVQYRINHRDLLAAISIKTMNTHWISDLNIDVQRMDQQSSVHQQTDGNEQAVKSCGINYFWTHQHCHKHSSRC